MLAETQESTSRGNGASQAAGLRPECLPLREVVAQSVANVAPTLTPTAIMPAVFASAGTGTWFAFLLATVGMVFVGLNINQFARRSASAGSLYTYIGAGLGPGMGVLAGWMLAYAYVGCGVACLCGFVHYSNQVLRLIGWQAPVPLLIVVCALTAWALAYRDIRLSAELMLGLEATSVAMILVLAGILIHQHGLVDPIQLHLEGMTTKGLQTGLVLCVFAFVGFESATSLGEEARDPLRNIPRAVLSSTIICGVFFVLLAYVEVLAFHGLAATLDKADAPLDTLAHAAGVPVFGGLISISATISFFACVLASINAAARVSYTLARQQYLHPALGVAHPTNGTPCVAASLLSLLGCWAAIALCAFGIKPLDAYGYVGTLSTYGFLLVYLAICVAAPMSLRALGILRPLDIAVSLITVVFMAWIVKGSVYPIPDPPQNLLAYMFGLFVLVGGVWYLLLRRFAPLLSQHRADDDGRTVPH